MAQGLWPAGTVLPGHSWACAGCQPCHRLLCVHWHSQMKCLTMSLWGKAKNKVPSELCSAVTPRGSRHSSAWCWHLLCFPLPFDLFLLPTWVVRLCLGTRTHENTPWAHAGTVHYGRLWRLLKAEVKSHIKAQSSGSSTVQRHQLPSRERQIVALIKRF